MKKILLLLLLMLPSFLFAQTRRYVGPYSGDAYCEDDFCVGTPGNPGNNKVATILPAHLLKNYTGYKIVGMRFALTQPIGASRAFVGTKDGENVTDLASADVASAERGWNEVTFATPVTITGEQDLLVGYDYVQKNTPLAGDYTDDCYPLSFVEEGDEFLQEFIYVGATKQWVDVTSGYDNLSVQLIVEGEFPDVDLYVNDVIVNGIYLKPGAKLDYSFTIGNLGDKAVDSYEAQVLVGNDVVGTFNSKVGAQSLDTIQSTTTLASDLAVGRYPLTVRLTKVNAAAPSGNTANDEASVEMTVYSDTKPRQRTLVEDYIDHNGTAFADADKSVSALVESYADRIARASLTRLADNESDEQVRIDSLISFFGMNYYPAVVFNRNASWGELTFNPNQIDSRNFAYIYQSLDDEAAFPAFLSVELKPTYDATSRQLSVSTRLEGVDGIDRLLPEARLNVYVVEDSVVAAQATENGTNANYVHNGVLRYILTPAAGETISWTDNQSEASHDVTVADKFNDKNLRVIAFVSNSFNSAYSDLFVNNCEEAKPDVQTGIHGLNLSGTRTAETYYDLSGRRIAKPEKGLYIIRFSDGSSKKIIK